MYNISIVGHYFKFVGRGDVGGRGGGGKEKKKKN